MIDISNSNDLLDFLDNTGNITGMQKFGWAFFPEFRRLPSPWYHDVIIRELLFLYATHEVVGNEEVIITKKKWERQQGVIAFRGSAKTTIATFLLPMYMLAFKGMPSYLTYNNKLYKLRLGEEVIVIASKTAEAAEQRCVVIRDYISTQNEFTDRFGIFKPRYVRDEKTTEWKRNAFVAINGTYVVSRGAGQQIRGINLNGHRPTVVVFDDIYAIDNTLTFDTRNKLDRWFFAEALDSIDRIEGKAVFIGTIVHEDTVPVKIRNMSEGKNPLWRCVDIPAINPDELMGILTKIDHDPMRGYFDMPEDNTIAEWEKTCTSIAWPESLSLKDILNLYRTNMAGRTLDYMYQEYLNVVQAPENKQFRMEMFTRSKMDYKFENDENWVYIEDEAKWYNANIYVSVDLASSERPGSDDTVVFVSAMLSDGRICCIYYIAGKMGQRDELKERDGIDTFRRDRSNIKKLGVVDETLRIIEIYHPKLIVVEVTQEQRKTFNEIRRVAGLFGIYPHMMPYKPTTNKIERIVSTLMGAYQTLSVIHQPWMTDLEYQLEKLGKAKHDDIPDALHMGVAYMKRPYHTYNKETFQQPKQLVSERWDWQTM